MVDAASELERQVAAEQAEYDAATAPLEAEPVSGDKSAAGDEAARMAADALAWLDTALTELRGALTACGKAIDAGSLDAAVVSGRMNSLVMEMMAGQ